MKAFTEKLGPLPVWAWVGVGAALYFFVLRPRLSGGSQAQPASFVQVPTGSQAGTGNFTSGPDLSGITDALNAISGQVGSMGQGVTQTPSNAPVPVAQSPVTNLIQSTYPPGFSFFANSGANSAPQLTYAGSVPAAGQTPATLNADVTQRLATAGLSPTQIAAFGGLTPGAHSSLTR